MKKKLHYLFNAILFICLFQVVIALSKNLPYNLDSHQFQSNTIVGLMAMIYTRQVWISKEIKELKEKNNREEDNSDSFDLKRLR